MKNYKTFVPAICLMAFLLAAATLASAQTTPQPLQISNVVSDPRWGATVPVGETLTVNFRAQLSDGRTISDFRVLPLVFQVYTSDGVRLGTDLLTCKPEIGQCKVGADKPRIVYMYVSMATGGLGYASVVVNFFRQNINMSPATIDITSSQVQADDGTSPTLTMTSPLASPGPVTINAVTLYTSQQDTTSKYVYLPDGVKQGQRITINTEDVRPLSFRDRRNFQVQMTGPAGYVIAQGFGSSAGTMETRRVDAQVDENGDLVFTLNETYNPAVDYTFAILRGNLFRVELAQYRAEVYVYPYGDKTKVVFNKGSLGENRFELPVGQYTVSMTARDRSNGIGWSAAQADGLNIDRGLTLQ